VTLRDRKPIVPHRRGEFIFVAYFGGTHTDGHTHSGYHITALFAGERGKNEQSNCFLLQQPNFSKLFYFILLHKLQTAKLISKFLNDFHTSDVPVELFQWISKLENLAIKQ
jgi:hypothetical protein